jgi:hypothetical protein
MNIRKKKLAQEQRIARLENVVSQLYFANKLIREELGKIQKSIAEPKEE